MSRNRLILLVIIVLTLGVAGTSVYTNLARESKARETAGQAAGGLEALTITSGEKRHNFKIEVARTNEERAKGLMYRHVLPEGRGMLFDFGSESNLAMWMKNTFIPLDMLFIQGNGKILRIEERTEPMSETVIPAGGAVRFVLEVNGGVAKQLGLKAGDIVLSPQIQK